MEIAVELAQSVGCVGSVCLAEVDCSVDCVDGDGKRGKRKMLWEMGYLYIYITRNRDEEAFIIHF